MARIKGIEIPNDKRVEISLTYIYGIGRNLSKQILSDAKVDINTKAKDLTDDEIARLKLKWKLIHTEEFVIRKSYQLEDKEQIETP